MIFQAVKDSGRCSLEQKVKNVAAAASAAQASAPSPATERTTTLKKPKVQKQAKAKAVKKLPKQSPPAAKKPQQCLPGSQAEQDYRRACGVPLALLQRFAKGCSSCRDRPGCTPSCWRKRGFTVH